MKKPVRNSGNVSLLLAASFGILSAGLASYNHIKARVRAKSDTKKMDRIESFYAAETALLAKQTELVKLTNQQGNYAQWLQQQGVSGANRNFSLQMENGRVFSKNAESDHPGVPTGLVNYAGGVPISIFDTQVMDKGTSKIRRFAPGALKVWTPAKNPEHADRIASGPQKICSDMKTGKDSQFGACLGKIYIHPPTANLEVATQTLGFSDGPVTIPYNQQVALRWTSQNATSCRLNAYGWNGTLLTARATPPLRVDTRFTLTCEGYGGTVTDDVIVRVTPQPAWEVIGGVPRINREIRHIWIHLNVDDTSTLVVESDRIYIRHDRYRSAHSIEMRFFDASGNLINSTNWSPQFAIGNGPRCGPEGWNGNVRWDDRGVGGAVNCHKSTCTCVSDVVYLSVPPRLQGSFSKTQGRGSTNAGANGSGTSAWLTFFDPQKSDSWYSGDLY